MRIESVLVLVLTLVACSGAADGGDVDVLPFQVVQASEFVFELGPFPAGNPADPQTSDISATGQVFTFAVEASTGGKTGAVEVRILAE